MTFKTPNQQNILEIAALRFTTIFAEADQEVTLKLPADAGGQGFIVLLQQSLPSIR